MRQQMGGQSGAGSGFIADHKGNDLVRYKSAVA